MLSTLLFIIVAGCGDKSTDTSDSTTVGDQFDSGIYYFLDDSGNNTVSHTGQTFRHLLISDVQFYVSSLNDRVNSEVFVPNQVQNDLLFYMETIKDIDVSIVPHGFSAGSYALLQENYGDISSGKNLFEKLAGNDSSTDHTDWSEEFMGWTQEGVSSPESLVRTWIQELDEQAVNWTVLSTQTPAVYISSDGKDYAQLLQKFLWGALAFSQGTDDYLDDDIDGKGLLSSHLIEEGAVYSSLEHAWDEGFGYFGAAQDYGTWSDEEVDAHVYLDRDGDGQIDVTKEVNWAHSRNASKRDLGSQVEVDFSGTAWDAFWNGRRMLRDTAGEDLSAAELNILREYRDQAVESWEMAIVSTVVHYVNETVQDVQSEADLTELAKHWSEAKGFALSLQFNPRSRISTAEFIRLHELLGQHPQRTEEYIDVLLEARDLLGQVYEIEEANLGGDNGQNGW